MATELRKTGISVVGDLPWGAHFCYFYETKQDLLDILIPYFKTGLENKEFCLWVISNSELLTVEEATSELRNALPDLDRYMAEQSIEVIGHEDWFLSGNTFDPYKVADRFKKKLNEALARGYAGMRVNGSPAWLHDAGPKELRKFEAELDKLFPNERTIASCTYPIASIGADEIFDVVRTHQFAIARRQGKWEVFETPEFIQAKAEIKKLNEELEQRVIERTNELRVANEELRKEIAERKHAEALLHAREQEFRAIVENAPDQIIRYDREFRRTYVNPAVAQFYGVPAEALIGKPIGSNISQAGAEVKEDEVARVRRRIADVFNTGKTYDYELTWTMLTGRTYFAVRLFPELDLNGSVVNVLGISRDITEHRSAQEELKREKEILEKVFDNTPVMIGFVGEDGAIKLVNREWERTIGWTLKELQEQNVDIFVEAYPDLSYRQEVLDFVAASTGEWVDLKIKVRDGRVIDAACAVVHLSDGTKVAIAQDITERKQAEEALDERLRFETLVTELSAAFANLTTNEVDQEIEKWLQSLAEFLGVDRASFFQFGDDWTTLYRSHSYTVSGIEPLPTPPLGMKEQFPWITEQLRRGVTVKWSRIPDDMPEEAVKEKEYAARLGVKSGLNIPVRMGGSVICAITFTSILAYRDWPDAMVARLRLVGEIFAAAVERKRAEAALRESEERFRQIAENIHEVFWMCTADFSKTLYISPAYEVVWGRSRESLYRDLRSAFAAIHPDDRIRAVTTIEAGREQGFEVEYRVVRPDGSIRWIWDRGFPIRDEAGRSYRLAGIAEDITERKQAEDALRRSEDHLRLVLDTTPALIHTGRPDGYLDYFNERWLKYVGCSLEELQGWGWTATIHPDDVEGIVNEWRASLVSGEPLLHEARVRQADGEYRWMLHRKVPLRDEHGNIVSWHGSSIDIEDHKQAEEKLLQSQRQLAEAQRLAHVGSFEWDLRTNAVIWSEELYRIFGLQPGEINVGGDARSFIHPEDRDLVMSTVNSCVKNKEPYSFHYRVLRPDGDERIVHSRSHVVSDEDGNTIRLFGATQDVTELKRAEEKLKATSQQLRALSARLQSAREEEGIRIAREIHDELGSSLTRLKWDLEIMSKEELATKDQERSEKSRRKISEMIALVDETVDMVRRISAELRPSALDDLGLGAALRLQAHQFQDRTGIIVDCDCAAESVKLTQQQSTAVFRICEEALTNVMRHSHATRVKVRLEIDQGDLVLTIRDNGLGITPVEMSDSSSLGLLGMRERAHLIGGEIEIEGIEDKGTVVTARVPISKGS